MASPLPIRIVHCFSSLWLWLFFLPPPPPQIPHPERFLQGGSLSIPIEMLVNWRNHTLHIVIILFSCRRERFQIIFVDGSVLNSWKILLLRPVESRIFVCSKLHFRRFNVNENNFANIHCVAAQYTHALATEMLLLVFFVRRGGG